MSYFSLLVVPEEEVVKYGCPYCGGSDTHVLGSVRGTLFHKCARRRHCEKVFCTTTTYSHAPFRINGTYTGKTYPHPFKGHPDRQTGISFQPQGVDHGITPGCLVCGDNHADLQFCLLGDVSGQEVPCIKKILGEYGIAIEEKGHDLYQVKLGFCQEHLYPLKRLGDFVSQNRVLPPNAFESFIANYAN